MSAPAHAGDPLPSSFYARLAEDVARDLLGALVTSTVDGELVAGRIVETEAYIGPHDPASHAAERTGRTVRNAAMFGPPGTAYIYLIYGIHWCLNAVTGSEGYPAAVLIRALEPTTGLEIMRRRRAAGKKGRDGADLAPDRADDTGAAAGAPPRDRDLARGPARLAQALGITGTLDGHPLQRPPLVIAAGAPIPDGLVDAGPRIGVTRAAEWPLRFFVRGSRWVSG